MVETLLYSSGVWCRAQRVKKVDVWKSVSPWTIIWCLQRPAVSGCSECHQLALETDSSKGNMCIRCDQVDYLLCLVAELREEVDRLRSIREAEKEINWWSRALTTQECTHEQPVKKARDQRELVTSPHRAEGRDAKENSEWKRVRKRGRRRTLPLPTTSPQVPLHNRFEVLDVEDKVMDCAGIDPSTSEEALRSEGPPSHITTSSKRKKRRVIAVGDFQLRGTEGPICRADPPLREVCCLPGAGVKDIAGKLPRLVRPSDYYPLLLFHVGADKVAVSSPKAIKKEFKALGWLVKESGAQVIFSSLLPVVGRDVERHRQTQSINTWLRGWCHRHNFGFFDHGTTYTWASLLAWNGDQLSQRGKRIFAQKLVGLIDRALN